MRRSMRLAVSLTAAMAVGAAASLFVHHVRAAGAPETASLTYSGQLALADGSVVSGPKNIGLALFDAATAGTRVCDAPSTAITVTAGHFDVPLPDACVAAIKADPNLWVEVQVDGGSIGRSKLTAVPYAIEASRAASALTASSATVAQSAASATVAQSAASATVAQSAVSATSAQTAASAQVAAKLASGPISAGLQFFNVSGASLAAPCVAVSGAVVDCTCPDGTYAVSGGGDAGQSSGKFIRESRPQTATQWRVTCASGTSDALCSTYSLVCSRIAP